MATKKDIRTVTVIGAGIMGRGSAHVAALGGFNTILNDISDDLLQKAYSKIQSELHKGTEIGKISSADAGAALSRLKLERELGRATSNSDLVIEAAPEKIEVKLDLFSRLDRTCPQK